jgi:predicted GNAT family N-acyltransferase
MITASIVPGQGDKSLAFAIRQKVFVEEQGFCQQTEFDEVDDIALHALVCDDGQPAATARLYQKDGTFHIGRVAVLPAFRRRGLGEMAMRLLMLKARELGAAEVALGAQVQARGFYEKLGFRSTGDLYDDEGVAHVRMVAKLDEAAHNCQGCASPCR